MAYPSTSIDGAVDHTVPELEDKINSHFGDASQHLTGADRTKFDSLQTGIVIDCASFGATSQAVGGADQYAAIQAAIDIAGEGDTVLLRPGYYPLSTPLTFPQHGTIVDFRGMLAPYSTYTGYLVDSMGDSASRTGQTGYNPQPSIHIFRLNAECHYQCRGARIRGYDHFLIENVWVNRNAGVGFGFGHLREGTIRNIKIMQGGASILNEANFDIFDYAASHPDANYRGLYAGATTYQPGDAVQYIDPWASDPEPASGTTDRTPKFSDQFYYWSGASPVSGTAPTPATNVSGGWRWIRGGDESNTMDIRDVELPYHFWVGVRIDGAPPMNNTRKLRFWAGQYHYIDMNGGSPTYSWPDGKGNNVNLTMSDTDPFFDLAQGHDLHFGGLNARTGSDSNTTLFKLGTSTDKWTSARIDVSCHLSGGGASAKCFDVAAGSVLKDEGAKQEFTGASATIYNGSGTVKRRGKRVEVARFANSFLEEVLIDERFGTGDNATGRIGAYGWQFTGGSTPTMQPAEQGHSGIVRMDTSAVATTLQTLYARATAGNGTIDLRDLFDFQMFFRVNQTDTDTMMRLGLSGNTTQNPAQNGVWIRKLYAESNWWLTASSGGTTTGTLIDSGVAVATGWAKMRIRRIASGSVRISINDGTETVFSTNLPSVAVQPFAQVQTQTAASKTMDLERVRLTTLTAEGE